ncbi:hypothetical protein B0H17DRAFT_1196896 [Mycena rosella]|uniref:Uncharacterized protein n=1 Tax=Mycena rosella TaxID=1033263 RepID=A0AAD7DU24_MYCRO|nr:hypothetical protein B0H17DRAFT_1196896 [Mycena rosella]
MSPDLLKNRDPKRALGPFGGQVAALARIGAETYFRTTNADYVPAVPSLQLPHQLFLRSDMRYGTDDPTLWPQQFTERYCHFAVIAKMGARPELAVMWWDPSPADFIVGSAVTRGLGRLRHSRLLALLSPVDHLVAQVGKLQRTSQTPIIPLFGLLIQTIRVWSEQLRTLPARYNTMVFMVTSLQRAGIAIAPCVGAFTVSPVVAQQLWAARVPFWFLRPSFVFDAENILAVVPLQEPIAIYSEAAGDGVPKVLYSGNNTLDKIAAIWRQALQTPWYHNPFETADDSSSPALETTHSSSRGCSPSPVTHPSAVASSSRSVAQANSQESHVGPSLARRDTPLMSRLSTTDPQKSPKASQKIGSKAFQNSASKGPSKTPRDKFAVLLVY